MPSIPTTPVLFAGCLPRGQGALEVPATFCRGESLRGSLVPWKHTQSMAVEAVGSAGAPGLWFYVG